ncbi:nitroreductase family protein, partial [Parasutterella excrementihominis]
MDFVKLSEQRFTAKKFDVNKKIPRDDVEKLKTILQLSPSSVNSQPWVFL